jgi:hypothetical protein
VAGVVNTVSARGRPTAERSSEAEHLLAGRGLLTERLRGLEFEVSPSAFFQTNPRQAERLYALVEEAAGELNFAFEFDGEGFFRPGLLPGPLDWLDCLGARPCWQTAPPLLRQRSPHSPHGATCTLPDPHPSTPPPVHADLRPSDVLLDLYCGTGTIGLTLASRCRQVRLLLGRALDLRPDPGPGAALPAGGATTTLNDPNTVPVTP